MSVRMNDFESTNQELRTEPRTTILEPGTWNLELKQCPPSPRNEWLVLHAIDLAVNYKFHSKSDNSCIESCIPFVIGILQVDALEGKAPDVKLRQDIRI